MFLWTCYKINLKTISNLERVYKYNKNIFPLTSETLPYTFYFIVLLSIKITYNSFTFFIKFQKSSMSFLWPACSWPRMSKRYGPSRSWWWQVSEPRDAVGWTQLPSQPAAVRPSGVGSLEKSGLKEHRSESKASLSSSCIVRTLCSYKLKQSLFPFWVLDFWSAKCLLC